MITSTTAAAITVLSQPVKDIYSAGKDKFANELAKWGNNRAIGALAKKVSAYEKVKTIWQRNKEVKLTSFYYPSKVTFSTGVTKKVSSLKDFPQTGGVVIEGTVGQGKSIFLRYLCIQELRSQSSGRIPVFIELRKLDSTLALKSFVFETLTNLGFEVNEDLFDFYATTGKIVLLLDAFDELNESQILPVITQLENWAEKYPAFQVIVSSRPSGEIQKSSHFSVLHLAPLGPDDHRPFLTKIGVKGKQLENLLGAVEQSPSQIKEFLNTPLLLTMLTQVYQADGTIPGELPDFFQVLFATVFSKHDGTKPGFKRPRKTGLNDRNLEMLFEAFCFAVMRRNYGVSLNEDQFATSFEDALKFKTEKCEPTAFRHDLVKVACLLLEDGYNLVFAHKSLLDYFCAAFIKHTTEKQAESIYGAIQNQHRHWRAVLQYVRYIDKYKFSKYFAIKHLHTTFSVLGVDPNTITDQSSEHVLEKIFGKSTAIFYFDKEKQKFRQNGLGNASPDETIHVQRIFFATLDSAVTLFPDFFTREEIEARFHNISENSIGDDIRLSAPWMQVVPAETKCRILKKIKEELLFLSTELKDRIEYVKQEDEKASELSMLSIS